MKLIAMRVAVAVLAWASAAMAASPGNAPQLPVTGARIINVATEPQLQTAMSNLQSGDTLQIGRASCRERV